MHLSSRRTGSAFQGRTAIATVTTVVSVCGWLFMDTDFAKGLLPRLAAAMPNNYWVSTFANLLLFGVAYGVSLLIGSRHGRDLTGLTIWHSGSPIDKGQADVVAKS